MPEACLRHDAALLLGLRLGNVGLLPARRRQRRVVRRLRRLTAAAFEFGDAGVERLDLCEQLVDLRQQPADQRIQAILVERIEYLRRHPELQSDCDVTLNADDPSQTDAEG